MTQMIAEEEQKNCYKKQINRNEQVRLNSIN